MKGNIEMPVSVLTKKWQTTIPKDIRNFLNLEPNDKILYQVEGDREILKPLKGNILDLRGSVATQDKPIDFRELRNQTKKKIARKIVQEAT